ncbi:MAG: hypothetical protein ACI4RA_10200, partial [Kiritimatiellia bacterium]
MKHTRVRVGALLGGVIAAAMASGAALDHVPAEELAQYEQVYSLEIPEMNPQYDQNTVKYQVDNHRMA